MKKFEPCVCVLPHRLQGRRGAKLVIIYEPPDPVWQDMSRYDFLRYCAFTRWTADQLGLRDWIIQINWEPADKDSTFKDCYARVSVVGDIKTATIWLSKDFHFIEEPEKRRAIVHELIHVHLDGLSHIGGEAIADATGKVFQSLLEEEMHRAIEMTTESLAQSFARLLDPIPPFFEEDDAIWIRTDQTNDEIHIWEYLGQPKTAKEQGG